MLIEWLHLGKPTVLGGATAAVAGLVAITPACASVTPLGSIAVGAGSAVLCYAAVALLKPRLGYDDSLDVFGVHGVGGTWGAIATGLFLSFGAKEGWTWLDQVLVQLKSVVFTAAFAPLMTIAILWILRRALGELRVDAESEAVGLDLSQHSETAYASGTGAHLGSLGGHSTGSSIITAPTHS
jgi:Amt family ammonium transporter